MFLESDKRSEEQLTKSKSPFPDDGKNGNPPPRRFISSFLGGDIPYGSRGHVLTRYITVETRLILICIKKISISERKKKNIPLQSRKKLHFLLKKLLKINQRPKS